MNTVLHITAKDLTGLRWQAALVAVLQLSYAALNVEPRPFPDPSRTGSLAGLVLLLAHAWFLATAVHAEALAGDRQYWPTRPIARRHLFIAKLLVALTVIHLPMLLSDFIILISHEISPLTYFPALLWRQLLYLLTATLPMLAVAAVTANLMQFVGAAFTAILAILLIPGWLSQGLRENTWSGFFWFKLQVIQALLITSTIAAILLLYVHRRIAVARIALAITAGLIPTCYALTPFPAAFHLQRTFSPAPPKTPSTQFDPATHQAMQNMRRPPGRLVIGLTVPFRFHPPLTTEIMNLDQAIGAARSANGDNTPVRLRASYPLDPTSPGHSLILTIDNNFLTRHRDESVSLDLTLYFTMFSPARRYTMPILQGTSHIPELGRCTARPEAGMVQLTCYSPKRPAPRITVQLVHPRTGVRAHREVSMHETLAYSPFPSDRFTFHPLQRVFTMFSIIALPGGNLVHKNLNHLLESTAEFHVRDAQGRFTTSLSIPPTPLKEFLQ